MPFLASIAGRRSQGPRVGPCFPGGRRNIEKNAENKEMKNRGRISLPTSSLFGKVGLRGDFRIPHSAFRIQKTPSRAHYERTSVCSDAVRCVLFVALAEFVPKSNDLRLHFAVDALSPVNCIEILILSPRTSISRPHYSITPAYFGRRHLQPISLVLLSDFNFTPLLRPISAGKICNQILLFSFWSSISRPYPTP